MVGDIFQPTHLLFILVIALLVLGPKRLPEVARSLGRGLRDFKGALSGEEPERHEEIVSQASTETVSQASTETVSPASTETAQPARDPAERPS